MKAKHTPGPWFAMGAEIRTAQGKTDSGRPRGDQVCRVNGYIAGLGTEAENVAVANALLIAAAPELLEALQAVVAIADRKTDEFDRARAAIAKATGETT